MEIVNTIVAVVALLAAVLAIDKAVARPRMRFCFWDPMSGRTSKTLTRTAGPTTLHLVLRNDGDLLRLWRPAATTLTAYVYFPREIQVKEIRRTERPEARHQEIFRASPSGRFANMHYVAVPSVYPIHPPCISILSHQEEVMCEVDVVLPDEDRQWDLACQMFSAQGDLGVHQLVLHGAKTGP